MQAGEQRQHTVVLRARSGHETAHDLKLQCHDHRLRSVVAPGQINDQRRGDRVRQVGYQLVLRPVVFGLAHNPQRVGVLEDEILSIREPLLQQFNQPAVLLNGGHVAGGLQQRIGQWPQPGSDLENLVGGIEPGQGDDLSHLMLVVQEVLAKRSGQLNVLLAKNAPNLR